MQQKKQGVQVKKNLYALFLYTQSAVTDYEEEQLSIKEYVVPVVMTHT